MSEVQNATEPAAPHAARPDLLAYPSPTTSRFLLLIVALLGSGLFVGDWLHSQVAGPDWVDATLACATLAQEQAAGLDALAQVDTGQSVLDTCRANTEGVRAVFVLGGAVVVGLGGLVALYVAPQVIRRRRRLRALGAGLEPARQRFAELARDAGLARCPGLVLGSSTQRDAFSYGTPGRYVVALPPAVAVRWRDPTLFDPVMRHELAHIRHRDVAFAWLARSIWYVLAPALALPLVVGVISGDNSLAPDYLWRAALLGITVQLVSAALLRSREHDADLRAARLSGRHEPVAAVVARARRSQPISWYRRALAAHPDPADRLTVLAQPQRGASVTVLDGFAAAFLAALTTPLGVSLLISGTTGTAPPSLAQLVVALVAGPLLGGSVGLALWRASVVGRAAGHGVSPWRAALGVAAGLVLGQLASLGKTGEGLSAVSHPVWFAVVATAGVGVTVLAFSVGELWAEAIPALPRAWLSWVPSLLITGLLFALIVWASQALDIILALGGWSAVELWLVAMPDQWLAAMTVAVLIVGVTVALAMRRPGALTPRWILERGEPAPWPVRSPRLAPVAAAAILAGLVGAATIVGFRLLVGPGGSDALTAQRHLAYIWVAAAVGATTTLVLAVLHPRIGLGFAALTGPLAAATTVAGFLAMYLALGSDLGGTFVVDALLPPIVIGFFLTVIVAPVALIARPGRWLVQRLWAVAVPAALVAGLMVIGITGVATPTPDDTTGPQVSPAARMYLGTVARDFLLGYQAIEEAVAAIDSDQVADGATRALRIRSEVLPPTRALRDDVEAYQPPTPEIGKVHESAVAMLAAKLESLELFALAFETDSAELLSEAQAKRDEEDRYVEHWFSGLTELADR